MTAPFYQSGLFAPETGLVIAFFIGIAFGFFLEKGGLGNSLKLSGQFYFTDLTVFKVMFTAIVTAMLGMSLLSWIGFLDLSQIDFSQTFAIPYLIAGLLFGVGFVIGGLCPGTSIVSAATGKIDGMILLLGVFFGIFIFGETFDSFNEFLFSTPMYKISIPEYFNASPGLIVFMVTLIALLGFWGSEILERKFAKDSVNIKNNRELNISFGIIALLISLFVLIAGNPDRTSYKIENIDGILISESITRKISSDELAEMILARRTDFVVVDLRSPNEYEEYKIPSAINFHDTLSLLELTASGKKIILYDQANSTNEKTMDQIKRELTGNILFLEGGLNAWFEKILFPNLNLPKGYSPEKITKISKRSRYFGGTPKLKKNGMTKGEKYAREGC